MKENDDLLMKILRDMDISLSRAAVMIMLEDGMLTADIVKEIKQENKIVMGLLLRNLICVLCALICSIFIFMFVPKEFSPYICAIFYIYVENTKL